MTSEVIVNTETGIVTRVFGSGKVNVIHGANNYGYLWLRLGGRMKLVHRLVWETANGPIPDGCDIDHINGVRTDNRLVNLRCATRSQNMQNQHRARVDSRSGQKGVTWDDGVGKWRARISVNGVKYWLGQFDDMGQAQSAYATAASIFHTHNPHARLSP